MKVTQQSTKTKTISARALRIELGYAEWRNFHSIIRRAQQLIASGLAVGFIRPDVSVVRIGSGAERRVMDFLLDVDAVALIKRLASTAKLEFRLRNETTILKLLEKYFHRRGFKVEFQKYYAECFFDCVIGNCVAVEFDEPHHDTSKQVSQDSYKNQLASQAGWRVVRIRVEHDIVDAISLIEKELS